MSDALTPLQKAALVVQDLRERVRMLEAAQPGPIAIVGLGCRFPGADDPDGYWRLLAEGGDATGQVPADRWDAAPLRASGRLATDRGGYLAAAADGFDAGFFGIAPREAVSIDPQQRLLMEVAWEALEDAGLAGGALADRAVGVFIGISMIDYARRLLDRPAEQIDAYAASGSLHSVASGRLSFSFNLTGPSVSIDTACSSSLVAIHLACRALRNNECTTAMAGGVNLLLAPELSVVFSAARMLSSDGRCKTFDAAADGYGRAEGCGVVVLKRLADAQASGDRILAVIRGSAVNQDGATSGLTVPNGPAQAAVIRAALADAGVAPGLVGLIEAHGTGTSLGDPIEMGALRDVFAKGRDARAPLLVGSVKTNIGHAEGAAGIAGLIKLVLSLQNRTVPAHLHVRTPSPLIDWADGALAVPQGSRPWAPIEGRWIGGVSSFGFSGTNAHVVLEAAPPETAAPVSAQVGIPGVYVVSGKDEAALASAIERHAAFLAGSSAAWPSLCQTATTGRAHFAHRAAVVASGATEAARLLRSAPLRGRVASGGRARAAFLFTGQGSVVAGMGLDLPAPGAAVIDAAAALLAGVLSQPLRSVLADATLLARTDHAQPALYAVQCALVACWRAQGVEPSAVLGHSVGEYAAAQAAGVFDFATGLRLVTERGRLMQALAEGGAMLAVALPAEAARGLIAGEALVSLGAENGPCSCVLSGDRSALERVAARLDTDVARQWLAVSHGFHSPLMRGVGPALGGLLGHATLRTPAIMMVPTGGAGPVDRASYWMEQVEAPVRFGPAMASLEEMSAFVEIGPQPVLLGLGRRCVAEKPERRWVASLTPGVPAAQALLEGVAALHVAGVAVTWQRIPGQPVRLPTYPWQRQSLWIPPAKQRAWQGDPMTPLRLESPLSQVLFTTRLASDAPSFLGAHRIDGTPVVPLAVMVRLASACAPLVSLDAGAMMVLDQPRDVQVVVDGETLSLHSRTGGGEWVRHATGAVGPIVARDPGTLAEWRARCPDAGDAAAHYQRAAAAGIALDAPFNGITALWHGPARTLGRVETPDGTPDAVMLDACFQVAVTLLPPGRWLPVRVEGVALPPLPSIVWVGAHLTQGGSIALSVFAGDGAPVGGVGQLEFRSSGFDADRLLYCIAWDAVPWTRSDALHLPAAAEALDHALQHEAAYAAALSEIETLAGGYAAAAMARIDPARVPPHRKRLFHHLAGMALQPVADLPREQARLEAAHPVAAIELSLLGRCGVALAGVVEGVTDPLSLLFPGGDSTDALALYGGSPWSRVMGACLQAAIRDLLADGAPLRVLEIGGGTAATTALVMPLLPLGSEYVFTDVSARFTRAAQARFPTVTCRMLDIERDPVLQGFVPGSFDLVIAANVLHATQDLAASVRHAASLLAAGGVLVVIEGTGRLAWGDLTFGLTDGWWRFADAPLRTDYPMLDVASWRGLLARTGFAAVAAFDAAAHPNGRQFQQAVILARRTSEAAGVWQVVGDAGETLRGLLNPPDAEAGPIAGTVVVATSPDGLRHAVAAAQAATSGMPLWFVTQGCSGQGAWDTTTGLHGAALRGLLRTMRRERPDIVCATLDLPASSGPADLAMAADVIRTPPPEDELSLRSGRLFAARLRPAGPTRPMLAGTPFRLEVETIGLIDSLRAQPMERPDPGPGEIVVETRAVGLNFRDVLLAMDLYPGGGSLGQECTGYVVAVGTGVQGFAVGDAVLAVAPGAMASHVAVPDTMCVLLPSGMDMAEAAAQPVAVITALHALVDIAGLRPGETVLVHAAASGTGLACLRVARALGARIVATASAPKQGLVMAEGASAVFDSRSTAFGALAGPVDVVVNALSGPGFVEASLATLAPGGRFVELGRRNVWNATEVGRVRPDVIYTALDLSGMAARRPAAIGVGLRRAMAWLAEGRIAPLPVQRIPIEQAVTALRTMELGSQTGKLVLTRAPGPTCYRGTWLVTGGLGGLGIAVAGWLVERGVQRVVLVGRSPPDAATAMRMAAMAGVEAWQADVRDRAAMVSAIQACGDLRGVIHAAGVLDDAPLEALGWDRFAALMRTKVDGARHLHELTRDHNLDAFILFGSATSLLGNAGQASHATANAWLDGLARHRHALGLPAISIAWGPWSEAGAAVGALDALQARGFGTMTVSQGLAALALALARNEPVLGALSIDWQRFLGPRPPRFFSAVAPQAVVGPRGPEALAPQNSGESVMARAIAVVASVLGLSTLEPDARFFEIGMDSLTAIETRHRLERAFSLKLDATIVLDYPTPTLLARYLDTRLTPAEPDLPPDDTDIEARLAQRLAAMGQ